MEIRTSSQDTERNVLCWGLMVWRLKAHIVNKLDRENNCLDRRNPSCGSDSGPQIEAWRCAIQSRSRSPLLPGHRSEKDPA